MTAEKYFVHFCNYSPDPYEHSYTVEVSRQEYEALAGDLILGKDLLKLENMIEEIKDYNSYVGVAPISRTIEIAIE